MGTAKVHGQRISINCRYRVNAKNQYSTSKTKKIKQLNTQR
jgi:hypothetical protein